MKDAGDVGRAVHRHREERSDAGISRCDITQPANNFARRLPHPAAQDSQRRVEDFEVIMRHEHSEDVGRAMRHREERSDAAISRYDIT